MATMTLKNVYAWPRFIKYFIFLFVFSAVVYLGYLWDISNLIQKIETTKEEEISLKNQIDKAIDKEVAVKKELLQFSVLKSDEDLWEKNIVIYRNLPKVFNDILKIGADNQLNFVTFDPEQSKPAIFYHKTPIKVVVVGTYHQIGNFLSQLGSLPSTIVVRNFLLSSENKTELLGEKLAKQANENNLISMETLLEIYHQPNLEKRS